MLSEFLSMLEDSRKDTGRFWNLDPRRIGAEPMPTIRMKNGDTTAEGMMLNFAESGHPVFRASSALEGGELKSKAKGKKFIHFNGSDETIELILSAIISVNQLSVYGAVAALCKELARDSSGAGKPAAHEIWNRWWYRENLLLLTLFLRLMREEQRKLLREYEQKFAELLEQQKLMTKLCSNAGFSKNIDKRTMLHYTWWRRSWRYERIMSRPVLDVYVCCHQGRYGVGIVIESLFRDRTVSWFRIVNGINKHVTETSEEISVASVENRGTGKLDANISSWSYDMEGHAKKCVERYFELANKTTQQFHKVATPMHGWSSVQRRRKRFSRRLVHSLLTNCSKMPVCGLYVARIGRPDILWFVYKLALASISLNGPEPVTKRPARLISYSHHTCELKHYCHVGNTAQQCRLWLFQDSDFAGDLEDSKSTSGGTLCIFGSHTFVPISWMCKKQTSVSHSSTESEIISLDAGLRLDGIPVLDLWDLIVAVLHGNTNQSNQERRDPHKFPTRKTIHGKIDDIDNVDFISSSVHSSRKEALLYIFEDNEAVIKTIIMEKKSNNETCIQNQQNCSWLGVWQN